MLRYINPEVVATVHTQAIRERYGDGGRRRFLRLANGGDVTERH